MGGGGGGGGEGGEESSSCFSFRMEVFLNSAEIICTIKCNKKQYSK